MRIDIDIEGQNSRRQQHLASLRQHHRSYFTERGSWALPTPPPENREWVWDVFAWVEGNVEEQEFASRLVLHAPELQPGNNNGSGCGPCPKEPYDIFSCSHSMHLLASHGERLTPAARQRLEGWASKTITGDPGGARADLQFHGYNDNMPAKATFGLIVGGEYFGSRKAVEHGLWNLHQLRLTLTRHGTIPEYCSPTYTAATLTNLTGISAHAANSEARELAQACCEHIWAEILAHYHPATRTIAGPYSRAYAYGSAGHHHNVHFLLWQTFGSGFVADPTPELFDPSTRLIIHHHGDLFFVQASSAFTASCQFCPPAYLLDWFKQRSYPFNFSATSERGEGLPMRHFHANRVTQNIHQNERFALGTSSGDWSQAGDRWHVVYRRNDPSTSGESPQGLPGFRDVRHLNLRYLVNEKIPGATATSPRGDATGEIACLHDEAQFHITQSGPISMVAALPFPELAAEPITRMGACLVVPEHLNEVDQIKFEDGHCWLEDGDFQLAISPLAVRRWDEDTPEFLILRSGHYRLLYFPNYNGPPRHFTPEQLQATTSAFVCVAASKRETPPAEFRQKVLSAHMLGYTWVNQTTLSWRGWGQCLEMSYGIYSQSLRYATVNGREQPSIPWKCDGLSHEQLPLTMTAAQPNPYPFPYEKDADGWQDFPSCQYRHDDVEALAHF